MPLQVPSVQLYVVTPAFPVVGVTDGAIEFEGGVVGATYGVDVTTHISKYTQHSIAEDGLRIGVDFLKVRLMFKL